MKRLSCLARTALLVFAASAPTDAGAVELMKDLPCALTRTIRKGSDFCLDIYNTCNTPIVSRIAEQNGVQQDSPQMEAGERGTVCSQAPFTFLGHYVPGP